MFQNTIYYTTPTFKFSYQNFMGFSLITPSFINYQYTYNIFFLPINYQFQFVFGEQKIQNNENFCQKQLKKSTKNLLFGNRCVKIRVNLVIFIRILKFFIEKTKFYLISTPTLELQECSKTVRIKKILNITNEQIFKAFFWPVIVKISIIE